MIKYIASDLDGTLLHNGAQQLPEEIFDLIRALKSRGIHFIAASGRQYYNMYRMFEPVQMIYLTLRKMVPYVFIITKSFPAV